MRRTGEDRRGIFIAPQTSFYRNPGHDCRCFAHGKPLMRKAKTKLRRRIVKSWLQSLLAFLLVLFLTPVCGGGPGSSTNISVAPGALAQQAAARPFIVFPITKWYPTRPKSQLATDVVMLILLVALPSVTAAGVRIFFQKQKGLGRPPSWGRLALGNGLVLIFLLSLMLLGGEILFRFFVDTTDSLGFTRICERWVARHWHTNSAGCRDNVQYFPA